MEGRRARGRQRKKHKDGIKALLECDDFEEVLRLAEWREEWRINVANVNEDKHFGKITFRNIDVLTQYLLLS